MWVCTMKVNKSRSALPKPDEQIMKSASEELRQNASERSGGLWIGSSRSRRTRKGTGIRQGTLRQLVGSGRRPMRDELTYARRGFSCVARARNNLTLHYCVGDTRPA